MIPAGNGPDDDSGREDLPAAVAEINTTPLIDVLLVLLVMLILIIPERPHAIDLSLPPPAPPAASPPVSVTLAIDRDGAVRWNGEALDGPAALEARLAALAARPGPPGLVLAAEADTAYRRVVTVMAAVRRAGLGPVTLRDPEPVER